MEASLKAGPREVGYCCVTRDVRGFGFPSILVGGICGRKRGKGNF